MFIYVYGELGSFLVLTVNTSSISYICVEFATHDDSLICITQGGNVFFSYLLRGTCSRIYSGVTCVEFTRVAGQRNASSGD